MEKYLINPVIAKTAPMGWNSWDCYGPSVDETTVRQNAEYMAKHLKKYGWEYIVVDIQWYEPSASGHKYNNFADVCIDEYSRVIPAENRFPSSKGGRGFKPLADYIHSLGLKFGIHIMRGIPRKAVHANEKIKGTDKRARDIAGVRVRRPGEESLFVNGCGWNTDMYGVDVSKEGAYEYYKSIFELYASWDVDFIKCDDIARELPHYEEELKLISKCLRSCGRDMVFSISPGPSKLEKSELYKEVANMWRMTDDFWDEWRLLYAMFERAEKWCTHAGAGHWPDADMLPFGPVRQRNDKGNWTRFTNDELYTNMTLWSIIRSPLILGGELTGFDDFTLKLVTNDEILKMHKNARHSHQVWRKDVNGTEHCLWVAQCCEGGLYAAIFNLGEQNSEIKIPLEDLEIETPVSLVDLWTGEKTQADRSIDVKLNAHGACAYYIHQ